MTARKRHLSYALKRRITALDHDEVPQAYGATVDVEFLQPVPAVHNTQPWIDTVLP